MESPLGARDHGEVCQLRGVNPYRASKQRTMFRAITSGLLFCWIATVPAAGQNCVDYTDYLHFIGSVDTPGNAIGIAVHGDHAYVADSNNDGPSHLLVLDITTALPEIVGSVVTTGTPLDVACDGTFAYVVSSPSPYYSTLQVVDVSNAASPVIVGSVNTPSNFEPEAPRSVTVAGAYAYVAIANCVEEGCENATGRLEIIDISNPTLPAIVGSVETPFQAMDVAVAGSHAYVATGFCDSVTCMGALEVVDVSNPASPAIVASVAMANVYSVVVAGTHAYVTGVGPPIGSGLYVFDISNPASPSMVGSVVTYLLSRLAVAGNLAYITGGPSLEVVDISNPDSPAIIGSTGLPGIWTASVAVAGNYVYIGGDLIRVVDISNPTSPGIIGRADLEGQVAKVVVAANLAYVARYLPGGLVVLDVSNPASPVIVGSVDMPSRAASVAVAGNYAYTVNWERIYEYPLLSSLQVVDISKPAPIVVGSLQIPGLARDVVVAGNFAYVVNHTELVSSVLQIVDISTPTVPVIVGSAVFPGQGRGVAVVGNYAFVVRGGDGDNTPPGLFIFDVSNPAAPVIIGNIVTEAADVAVAGNLACVAGYNGLEILDVSNPASPAIIGSIDAVYNANSVAIDGNYVYTSNRFGVRVIDISNPASPAFVGGADVLSNPSVTDVAVENGLAYIANQIGGLLILPTQCQAPTSVEPPLSPAGMPRYLLSQNHPNPFVAEVGATAIGFTLRDQSHASLRVFDASGRLVRVLIDEQLAAGPHTARWDGRNSSGVDAGAGIYYYRLEAGEFSEARALVKLK